MLRARNATDQRGRYRGYASTHEWELVFSPKFDLEQATTFRAVMAEVTPDGQQASIRQCCEVLKFLVPGFKVERWKSLTSLPLSETLTTDLLGEGYSEDTAATMTLDGGISWFPVISYGITTAGLSAQGSSRHMEILNRYLAQEPDHGGPQ